jgi:nitrate reductase assembly molybdenum cofactor insertion protein NarJ
MPETSIDPAVASLLREAQTWHLIGRLLERPRASWYEDVNGLAGGMDDAELRDVAGLARNANERRYLAAFGPSGVVSPREVAHCGMRDPGQLLAELNTNYEMFGFRPRMEDTIDHVAVETDFVAYLRFKEAFALSQGETEKAEVTKDAATRFIDEHLREMGEPIADRLEESAEPYLARAARALARRVGKPTHDGAPNKVLWLDHDDEGMTCGE